MGVYEDILKRNEKRRLVKEGVIDTQQENNNSTQNINMWQQITDMANSMNNKVNQTINERIKTAPSFMQNMVSPMQNLTLQQKRQLIDNRTNQTMNEVKNRMNRPLWEQIQDFANDTGRTIENTWLGSKHGVEDSINYVDFMLNGEKSQKEKELTRVLFSNLSDEQKKMYLAQNSQLGLLLNEDSSEKIAETINKALPIKVSAEMIEKMRNDYKSKLPINMTDENLAKMRQYFKDNYNKEETEKIATTDVQAEARKKEDEKIAQNIEQQTNPVAKKLAELAPSVGQMVPGMVLSTVNPALGATYFTTSAGGGYLQDAKERGMDETQSKVYATAMGIMEGLTEELSVGNLKKAGTAMKTLITGKEVAKESAKQVATNSIKEALKNYGIGIAENMVQEAIMEPIQETMAGLVADKADWSNMPERMINSGIDGGLVAVITGGGEIGINSCVAVTEKLKNGVKPTQQEIQKAVQDSINIRGEESVQKDFKEGAKNAISSQNQQTTIENKLSNIQEQQTTTPVQENASNQNVVANQQQNSLKVKSFEDIVDEAMSNYENNEIKSPLQDRNINTIGKKTKVNAYQYDNPEVKPYFQEMAQMLGEDIGNIASSDNRKTTKGGGTSLNSNISAIKQLKEMGYSYNQIIDGIVNIIDDHGKENNALSKKLEIIIDDQLRNGYVNSYGKYISPNEEYINLISKNNVQTNQKLPTVKENLPVQNNIIENNNKDKTQVNQEVLDYIKKNNINMTADEFMEWASNKQLEQENITDAKQQELYNLIYDIQNLKNNQEGIVYHNIINENGKIVDKITGKVYNINDDIIPYISADEEKLKYIPYSQAEDFYKLSVDEMDRAVALCSEDANKLYLEGKTKGSSIGENYIYDYDITGEDAFGIKKVEPIKGTTKEVINEEYSKTDSTKTQTNWNEQRRSNNDNKSISRNNGRTMRENVEMDREQSRQGLLRDERSGKTNSKTIENSNKSSFSMEEDTSNNTEENELQRKINRSMTMQEAKDMIQRAFVTGDIYNWYDGKYKNGDEWIAGEGIDDVAMWIDNDYNLQNKYINSNEDILNEEYMIEDVLEAYQNGTLTGNSDKLTQRLDISKNTNYKDDRFYALKDIQGGKELYEIANQRVTNVNRQKVYKARADFILNAHNEGYVESLGLTQKEVNEKLRNWANYPKKAMEISKFINKGVALENKWVGIENSSIVNELSISQRQLDSLVKEIKGTTNEWQRRYIANTMLAIDTHMDYTGLTYDFAPDVKNMGEKALADYYAGTDTIRVRREGQNTIAHETGHFIDHLLGRKIGDGYNLGITKLCRSNIENTLNGRTYTQEQKQFLNNFNNFLSSIEDVSDIGSKYKMDSQEVFARFVARFTEWTRNTATNGRYGYEADWYKDNFTTAQYMEFAKLLQEYSKLETTGQVSSKIDKSKGNKYDQRIEDIYSELFNNKEKINLPIKETSKEVNLPTKGEEINWNEIERPEGKFRKHYQSIIESSNTTAEAKAIAKELMGTDTYIPESNQKHIAEADSRIKSNGADNSLNALSTNVFNGDKRITAVDIATGERLIEYYSKIGDKVKLQEAIQATAMAGTQAGQAVQALSLLNHMTPQGQVTWIQRSVDKINKDLKKKRGKNAPQFELTADMQQKILQSENKQQLQKNLDEVYKELGQQVPKSVIEKIDSWRYFSMLGNPRTHIRNILGNFFMGKTQDVKNKVAGVIEGTVSKFNPDMERTHTLKRPSKEVLRFAKNDIANVTDRLGLTENKYNPQSRIQNNQRTFKSDVWEYTLGKLFDLNNSALEAEDGWGLKAGYKKSLAEYITANNIDIKNITDAQLSKARNYAIKEAQERTFHQANAVASAVNSFFNKNKVTKAIGDATVPFVKTPANVAKAGLEYSPFGLAKSIIYDTAQLRKGNITVNQYINNISKGLTGSSITVLGFALAQAGVLKASGSDDDRKEKFDQQNGKQAYSIQIGDKTYTLDWLAPAGIPLMVGAEFYERLTQKENEKSSISTDDEEILQKFLSKAETFASSLSSTLNPMVEMSMLSNLTSAVRSFSQGETEALANMVTNAGKSYINQFVPTALGQIAKTTDTVERDTTSTKTGMIEKAFDSTKNQIMSKIPGLRQQLPSKKEIWGNDVELADNWAERFFNAGILPTNQKTINEDKVVKSLNKLYGETGESSVLPKTIEKTFTINDTKYRMTDSEYNKYKKDFGKTSYNLLNNLVSSKEYNALDNNQKQKAIENVYSYAKELNKVDYAKKVGQEVKTDTLYNTMQALGNAESQGQYLSYLSKTTGMDKESEKNAVLKDSDFDNTTKALIYENTTGKDDKVFNTIKTTVKMNQYLDYKVKSANKEFQADKDENGKSISGSAKTKLYNYVYNNITGYENRLLLLANQYKLSRAEQQKIVDYVNKTSKTNEEVIDKLEKLSQNFQVKDGKVYFK